MGFEEAISQGRAIQTSYFTLENRVDKKADNKTAAFFLNIRDNTD